MDGTAESGVAHGNNVGRSDHPPAIALSTDIASTFTFASHQNSIPVVRSISIRNETSDVLESLKLELSATPPFLRPKTWTIDRINPGDDVRLSDRRVDLDPAYLTGLDEAERGEIALRVVQKGNTLFESFVPVRLLARDEWGGVSDMAQILPAFVTPNDPAIFGLLRSAAEKLAAHGRPSALDGYQSKDPRRAYLLAGSIYSAVAGLGLLYAEPPASFESQGQKVRGPSKIVEDAIATCLDTTLLFAAALEAVGLNSIAIMLEGHSLIGVWLVKRTLPRTTEPDVAEVRKSIAARELIVLETTGVAHRPPMTFEHAKRIAEAKLKDGAPDRFIVAIDIARSRSGGILPLASHQPQTAAEATTREDIEVPLPNEPDIPMPAEVVEQKPTTPTGRIERWQARLLDLSLRNRLLNFADGKRTIPFLCPDVGHLEDRLADNASIKLISLPEQNPLGERDAELHRDREGHDLQKTFAEEALRRDELSSTLEPKDLFARLTELYRQAKSDLAEGGTNTLYLAVGILRWKKAPSEERVYRAPILLLPVKLERSGVSDRFRLRFHEDEPRLNSTLLQFLKHDFDLNLPDFRDGLPKDENGLDVLQILEHMRRAVRDVPGFEVTDDIALSTFSFAKYLMWKDLTDRVTELRQNRVVRHLIDNPEAAFDADVRRFPSEDDIDYEYAAADIVTPLSADSSQIAACLAAAQGRDFVIVGPPGTGKSQTIANMIAMCLSGGKTVLFVAEKTAALDVVHRRLKEHGLGDHCLELHSNKADRRQFFSQLKTSWEKRSASTASQWVPLNSRLQIRRDELNAYVNALHLQATNGLTPFTAIGITIQGSSDHAPTLAWSHKDHHDATSFAELEALSEKLGLTHSAVKTKPVLRLVEAREWSNAWQEQLIASARGLGRAANAVQSALSTFSSRLGLQDLEDTGRDGLKHFYNLAQNLVTTAGKDFTIVLHKDFLSLTRALSELEASIAVYRDLEVGLSVAILGT